MKLHGTYAVTAALGAAAALFAACGNDAAKNGTTPTVDASASAACPPCVTDQDCGGGVCAQLGSDSACAPLCGDGNACASDRTCISATTVSGEQASVCVPRGDECGASGTADAGASDGGVCGTLVGPASQAACTSCAGKPGCQPNGCYGGWWCDTATSRCQPPPAACVSSGNGAAVDAGPPVTGTVGANGGTLSRLLFAVVGDTRPGLIDDTKGYPSAVIGKIYDQLAKFAPAVPFVVTTGDYMFASIYRGQAGPQLDLYLAAQATFRGTAFPALGNHECTGATASNCGPGSTDGVTQNYTAFMSKMLGPIQKSDPYYAVNVSAADASWTAKFVFVAANAWSTAQESWLETELSRPTTYTFVVRHESRSANTAPGVTPSEMVMARHPITLSLVGHTHTYDHYASYKELVVGNGGAPLTGGKSYGFAVLNQRPDGAIEVDMVDWQSGLGDASFRFAVKADGNPAP